MSMIGRLLRVPADKVRGLPPSSQPQLEQLYPDDGCESDPEKSLDMDKSWHLIHFLLTGSAWGGEGPVANAILGGKEIVDTDAGYGPFRYLSPADVQATSEALAEVDTNSLWSRFDAKQVSEADIYTSPWTGDDPEREYIAQNYMALRNFYSSAAAAGDGMLLYIS